MMVVVKDFSGIIAESEAMEKNTHVVRILLCSKGACTYCYIRFLLPCYSCHRLGARS